MFFDYEEFKSLAEKENLIVDRNEYGAVYFGDEKTGGEKLLGYVSVSSVGFNQAFYFPQIMSGQYQKTLGEFIYKSDSKYNCILKFIRHSQRGSLQDFLMSFREKASPREQLYP